MSGPQGCLSPAPPLIGSRGTESFSALACTFFFSLHPPDALAFFPRPPGNFSHNLVVGSSVQPQRLMASSVCYTACCSCLPFWALARASSDNTATAAIMRSFGFGDLHQRPPHFISPSLSLLGRSRHAANRIVADCTRTRTRAGSRVSGGTIQLGP